MKLVSEFKIVDYTKEVIKNPQKYYATEMVKDKSLIQYFYLTVLNFAYWLYPTYIWVLKKK